MRHSTVFTKLSIHWFYRADLLSKLQNQIPRFRIPLKLPLRHERITSGESPIKKATWQLKQVCKHLPVRLGQTPDNQQEQSIINKLLMNRIKHSLLTLY